jgi:biopolymer transport protein ExbD
VGVQLGAGAMSRGHSGSESKIPVLPLVDILFSAFAAVLATATVAIAMMRVRARPQPLLRGDTSKRKAGDVLQLLHC